MVRKNGTHAKLLGAVEQHSHGCFNGGYMHDKSRFKTLRISIHVNRSTNPTLPTRATAKIINPSTFPANLLKTQGDIRTT